MKTTILFLVSIITLTLPCQAMPGDEEKSMHAVKKVMGKTVAELQEIGATASYPFLPRSLGNMIVVNKEGELKISCPEKSNEEAIQSRYAELAEAIDTGYIMESIDISTKESQNHEGAFCKGKTHLKLTDKTKFSGKHAIFGSEGEINFTSPTFEFSSSFIEVDPAKTTITISPPADLNCPISSLVYTPTQSPVFIQGKIDFKNLSFKDFIVSHAELKIVFKRNPSSQSATTGE